MGERVVQIGPMKLTEMVALLDEVLEQMDPGGVMREIMDKHSVRILADDPWEPVEDDDPC